MSEEDKKQRYAWELFTKCDRCGLVVEDSEITPYQYNGEEWLLCSDCIEEMKEP